MISRLIIVGAGHAAGQIVATLRQKKFAGEIHLIGEEHWLPYQRPPLSKKFLAGELPAERLYVKPPAFYEDPSLTVRLGTRIAGIDRKHRQVVPENGAAQPYDKLILSIGASARRLRLPGCELSGVHYLRTIDDVLAIREYVRKGRRMVIVGGGYIGLEVAAVTATLGMDVTVVEMQDRVMKRVVSPQISKIYEEVHRAHGVELRLNAGIDRFLGEKHVVGVKLADGQEIAADVVVVGIGIQPNVGLAAEAGLEVSDGIVVNDHCLTSDQDIFAVGDCTFHPNALLGRSIRLESVHNALEQARTAAANVCGEDLRYADVPWFWSDQYDLKLQIAGLSEGYDKAIMRGDAEQHSFSCVYLKGGRIIAVDAVNSPKDFIQSKKLIAQHATLDIAGVPDPAIELKDLAV